MTLSIPYDDLEIHPENGSLLLLPRNHPAHRLLIVHAECRAMCVGREIFWPDMGEEPIDQEWFSMIDQKTWKYSSFAYTYLSYSLVLENWLSNEEEIEPFERKFIEDLPRIQGLLEECESVAKTDGNTEVLPLIEKTCEYFESFRKSIIARVGEIA